MRRDRLIVAMVCQVALTLILGAFAQTTVTAQSANENVILTVEPAVQIYVPPWTDPNGIYTDGKYHMDILASAIEGSQYVTPNRNIPVHVRSNSDCWVRVPRSVALVGATSSYPFTARVTIENSGEPPVWQDANYWYQNFGPVQPRTKVITANVGFDGHTWGFADLAGEYTGVLTVDVVPGTAKPGAWSPGGWYPVP